MKQLKRVFGFGVLVVLVIVFFMGGLWLPKAEAVQVTVSTNGALYNQVTWHYARQWKGPWVAPAGATILRARFKGNSEYRYDYGYVYAYVNGTWYYVTSRSGSYDYWVNLPAGTTQIKTLMTTDGSVLWNPTYTDVPEVVLNVSIQVPGQPQLPYDGTISYWQQRITWSTNNNPAGTTYELWRKVFDPTQLVPGSGLFVTVFNTQSWYNTVGHPSDHAGLMTFFDQS